VKTSIQLEESTTTRSGVTGDPLGDYDLKLWGYARHPPQGMNFADALHLARSESCGALISFDRQLALVAGQLNLQPTAKSP